MRFSDVRLLVDDFDASFAFFSQAMGFKASFHVEGTYAEFDADGGTLSIYRRDLMRQELHGEDAGDFVYTFHVDDVEEAFRRLVEGGATAINEPYYQETWEIRVAHLRDPAGNVIELEERR